MASVSTRSSTTRSYTYYVHCGCNDVTSQTSAILRLENCIEEVSHWMSANRLKLNADKTELLLARSRHSPALLESAGPSLQLGTETVAASDQVRVLGVTLTSDLCLDKHVTHRRWQRAAHCQRLCDVLLLASPTQTGSDVHLTSTLVHALLASHTCGLLQRHSRWGTKSTTDKLGAPASTECCRSRCQRRAEVRPRTHPSPARRAALTGCSSAGAQAVSASLSAAQSTAYITDCCTHTSDNARRQHLWSAGCH